jgi:hypothetical protein
LNERGLDRDLPLHRRVELVEDGRDTEDECRLHLGQVVDDLVGALADREARTVGQKHVELGRLPEGVRPREERERAVVWNEREERSDRRYVRRKVRVREEDPLGRPCRPARVDEACDVARLGRDERRLFPRLEERTIRRDARAVLGLPLEKDEVRKRSEAAEKPPRLFEDGLRGNDEDLRVAVLDDELPLLRELRFVHRDERRAERVRRIRSDDPLDAVVRHDRDAIPLAHADRREPAAEAVHVPPELRVGRVAPRAVLLRSEDFSRCKRSDAKGKDVDEGLEFHRSGSHDRG